MDPAAAKQQIAERVKQATKFLVTVSANPTVDQLAACIGLTLMLNKMGKHATAVFSGKVPNTIEFLQPEKTLETNTNSLQDFIISLDKNKADKLRYKVEDQYVRIFITPYRTSLSEKDLVFSQGDFNVEVVMALGIRQRTQIDQAIAAHGRILHDATVISVNTGGGKAPDIGQINWQDETASSLSEMLVSISEAFGPGLIDAQMATAFLTGIVAETDRFSNAKTSPKVMTMSAQLMAAGANQQLIVSKLEPPPPPLPKQPPPQAPPPKPRAPKPKQPPLKPEGELEVPRNGKKTKENQEVEVTPTEIRIDEKGNLITDQKIHNIPQTQPASPPPPNPIQPPSPPSAVLPQTSPRPPSSSEHHHAYLDPLGQPAATNGSGNQPNWAAPYDLVPMDSANQTDPVNENAPSGRPSPAPSTQDVQTSVDEIGVTQPVPMHAAPLSPALDNARQAVNSAIAEAPFDPAFAPPQAALNSRPVNLESPAMESSDVPALPSSDTPMLVLPTPNGGQTPVVPQQSIVQTSLPPSGDIQPAAPPPVPPPLMTGNGAMIPNTPQTNGVK